MRRRVSGSEADREKRMMDEQDSRRFPIQEHMGFQRATWIVERLGWAIIAMVPVLGLSGVLAGGILSNQVVQAPDNPLTVEYQRFQRATALTRFTARISESSGEEIGLRLGHALQEHYEIESVQPRPSHSSASPSAFELKFERPESGETTVVILARPRRFGLIELTAAANSAEALKFSVLVYP